MRILREKATSVANNKSHRDCILFLCSHAMIKNLIECSIIYRRHVMVIRRSIQFSFMKNDRSRIARFHFVFARASAFLGKKRNLRIYFHFRCVIYLYNSQHNFSKNYYFPQMQS